MLVKSGLHDTTHSDTNTILITIIIVWYPSTIGIVVFMVTTINGYQSHITVHGTYFVNI